MPRSSCLVTALLTITILGAIGFPGQVALAEPLPVPSFTKPEPVLLGEKHTIPSANLLEYREVFISLPSGYQNSSDRFPVLFVLDGHLHFEPVATTVRFLSSQGMLPELIVVGVSNSVHRNRDLTPTFHSDEPKSGGAQEFLQFLENELVQYLDDHYRTRPYRILAGHSHGGLFALFTLYSGSDVWNAFFAISPSLYWDREQFALSGVEFLRKPGGEPRFVFLSLANESYQALRQPFDELAETFKFQAKARNIRFSHHRYPEEAHRSTALMAYYDALRALYEKWPLPNHRRREGLAGLETHFAELSSLFGYKISIPERDLNALGYRHLGNSNFKEAIRIFRMNFENYPESPNACDSLADALEKSGDLKQAREYYARAVELAESSGHPMTLLFQENLQRVKESLTQ